MQVISISLYVKWLSLKEKDALYPFNYKNYGDICYVHLPFHTIKYSTFYYFFGSCVWFPFLIRFWEVGKKPVVHTKILNIYLQLRANQYLLVPVSYLLLVPVDFWKNKKNTQLLIHISCFFVFFYIRKGNHTHFTPQIFVTWYEYYQICSDLCMNF